MSLDRPDPSKIVAVAKNYADHAAEMHSVAPFRPMIFLKPSTAVIGPGEAIELPSQSERVDYEAELAVVIGTRARNIAAADADSVIMGYTIANDVTARDLQATDGQWSRSKSFDTFCPLFDEVNTEITSDDVAAGLSITCELNGEVVQQSTTEHMIHSVPRLVEWITSIMTLLPGDVILTGTPAGMGQLHSGDEVSVTIERIGTLNNPVA